MKCGSRLLNFTLWLLGLVCEFTGPIETTREGCGEGNGYVLVKAIDTNDRVVLKIIGAGKKK